MTSERPPAFRKTRWTILGVAAVAAVVAMLHLFGIGGAWPAMALLACALALFLGGLPRGRRRRRMPPPTIERALDTNLSIDGGHDVEADPPARWQQDQHGPGAAARDEGKFLAMMSHEIRTPLNGIVPILDLLGQSALESDQAELVRTAYMSSQQLLRIVDDILDYSKLEADRLVLEETDFDLRELLEGVVQLFVRSAHGKGLRLGLHIDPAIGPLVRGDQIRLRQVMSNLVGNAVKFTEKGTVLVSVHSLGESGEHHRIRFEVRDTGIGISDSAQGRLFQVFSQAEASTSRVYGGTGLGLAICKRIVELMGGQIGVQSVPGQGACFRVEVPMLKAQSGTAPALGGGGEPRLLLITRDATLRLRLELMLADRGWTVTSTDTAHDAFRRLRRSDASQAPTYQTVLVDLASLPNGARALYQALAQYPDHDGIRLAFICDGHEVPAAFKARSVVLSHPVSDAALRAAFLDPRALADESVNRVDFEHATEEQAVKETSARSRGHVLLVEDNVVNQMVGRHLLAALGIDCDTADNGQEALLLLATSHYDLVLMDCHMPVMDGYTATAQWRQLETGGRRLPIIAITANVMADNRQRCMDAGMDDYIPKPVTRSQLERCLHRWLLQAQAPSATTDSTPQPSARFSDGSQLAPELGPAHSETEEPPQTRQTVDLSKAASTEFEGPPAGIGKAAVRRAGTFDTHALSADIGAAEAASGTSGDDWGEWTSGSFGHAPTTADLAPAKPESSQSAAVIDAAIHDRLRMMAGNGYAPLIDAFLDETPKLIARMELAAANLQYETLREAAHSLKSASQYLGALALSKAAERMESGALQWDIQRPTVAVALIAHEYARVRRRLRPEGRGGNG